MLSSYIYIMYELCGAAKERYNDMTLIGVEAEDMGSGIAYAMKRGRDLALFEKSDINQNFLVIIKTNISYII